MGRVKLLGERGKKPLSPEMVSLCQTTAKLRTDLEKVYADGKQVTDYSLGFTNAFIFIEHRMLKKKGKPSFYNHKTEIGYLPKPTHLETEAEAEAKRLLQGVYEAAQDFLLQVSLVKPAISIQLKDQITALDEKVQEVERFVLALDEESCAPNPEARAPSTADDGEPV